MPQHADERSPSSWVNPWRTQYRLHGDQSWYLGELGDEALCRGAANRLWSDPAVSQVRVIELVPEVRGIKRR